MLMQSQISINDIGIIHQQIRDIKKTIHKNIVNFWQFNMIFWRGNNNATNVFLIVANNTTTEIRDTIDRSNALQRVSIEL